MILESIYESIFSKSSHGFRPNRSCHTALHLWKINICKNRTCPGTLRSAGITAMIVPLLHISSLQHFPYQCQSQGSMTAGVDRKSLDGMSERRINALIESLKDFSYHHTSFLFLYWTIDCRPSPCGRYYSLPLLRLSLWLSVETKGSVWGRKLYCLKDSQRLGLTISPTKWKVIRWCLGGL